MRAVLSVSDKAGLAGLARGLVDLGWELYSTGRTQRALEMEGVPVRSVSDLTSFPEILDGRVKTLHPRLHAGILARRDVPAHRAELEEHGIGVIDLVVSNLYPFVETAAACPVPFGALERAGVSEGSQGAIPDAVQEAIQEIDIGGPTMVRAAAKNFEHVVIVTDPADYAPVLEALRTGGMSLVRRAQLAQKAFQHTAQYDAYVAQYFAAANGAQLAEAVALPLTKVLPLSYGENPHQHAALYRLADPRLAGPSVADLQQLHGDPLSYNNLLDLDNAYALVAEFDEPAVAIVKHNNPCGAATGATLAQAYQKAYAGDPLSAFGGVVAANRAVDAETARATRGVLYWVMVAPEYDEEALRILRRYKKQLRICRLPVPARAPSAHVWPGFALHYRPVAGGFLAQTRDAIPLSAVTFTTVSRREPEKEELNDLHFAWQVVKHVRSNASVFVRQGAIVGVGAGQMSRVDSVVAAIRAARRSGHTAPGAAEGVKRDERDANPVPPVGADQPAEASGEQPGEQPGPSGEKPAAGCVMATDGFFVHPDAVEAAARAGITAIAHPGGGREDEVAVATADRYGLAMLVTGYRHFRH